MSEKLSCIRMLCDVVDADMMARHLESADDLAPVRVVIANAGVGGEAVLASATAEPGTLARHVVNVNTIGVINTVAPLIERFVARRSGHITVISSMAGFEGLAEAPAYAASKAAVRIYGHGLRRLSLPFPTPFAWPAERAAERIARGISRREAEIVFPWQLRTIAAAAALLPRPVVDRLVSSAWLKAWSR